MARKIWKRILHGSSGKTFLNGLGEGLVIGSIGGLIMFLAMPEVLTVLGGPLQLFSLAVALMAAVFFVSLFDGLFYALGICLGAMIGSGIVMSVAVYFGWTAGAVVVAAVVFIAGIRIMRAAKRRIPTAGQGNRVPASC